MSRKNASLEYKSDRRRVLLMSKKITKVVIHQPDFIPYLGFFDRLQLCDKYVILDHVQLSKSGWTHRDKILTQNGVEWLSVPIVEIKKKPFIKDALIAHGKDYDKIIRKINNAYRCSPYFKEVFPFLEAIFVKKPKKLVELNCDIINAIVDYLNINISITYSSELNIQLLRSEMNAEITRLCGGSTYISGMGAKNYHIDKPFTDRDLDVEWRSFESFEYPQYSDTFVANLSVLDVIMNENPDKIMDRIGK